MMTGKELGQQPASPQVPFYHPDQGTQVVGSFFGFMDGLTKREAFAMAIMQGMAAKGGQDCTAEGSVRDAVDLADALLAELAKEQA